MRKLGSLLILFLIVTIVLSAGVVNAQNFDVDVDSAILIEVETGQIIFEKNADRKLPPASITKIMTLLIAMEKVEDGSIHLDDEVTISSFAESMGGSQIYLKANTKVKMGDLLKSITIASANDASVAVAEAIAGTYSNFVSMMNERADELGMNNTNFTNSTGLPDPSGEHYSTARDIMIMAQELVKYDQIREWASIWVEYLQLPNRKAMLVNTNSLINKYTGMDGLKTGHTDEAGFCLAATAKKGETRLVSVVLQADTLADREEATIRLLDYGFNGFTKKQLAEKGDTVQNISLPNGAEPFIVGEVAADLYVIVRKGREDELSRKVRLIENLKAPIEKGEVLGELVVLQGDKELSKIDIVALKNYDKANFLVRIWRGIVNWIGSFLK